eukprot:gb/GEZN01004226.1/.p1 GENE.gb/GEZN01004226.1/~~gb/GEZN01004226.1/.p1  ORF type:complete len:559 (+),score=52.52 gb/GEZN01004226.1/:73-1677(+)
MIATGLSPAAPLALLGAKVASERHRERYRTSLTPHRETAEMPEQQHVHDEIWVLVVDDPIILGHASDCSLEEKASRLGGSPRNKFLRFPIVDEALQAIMRSVAQKLKCQVAVLSCEPGTGRQFWNRLTVTTDSEYKDSQLSVRIKTGEPVSFQNRFSRSKETPSGPQLCCPVCGGGSEFGETEASSISIISSARSDTSEELTSIGSDSEEQELLGLSEPSTLSEVEETETVATYTSIPPGSFSSPCLPSIPSASNPPVSFSSPCPPSIPSAITASGSSSAKLKHSLPTPPLHMPGETFCQVFKALTLTALRPGAPIPGYSPRRNRGKPKSSEHVHFVAETNLPTLKGIYRVRAYQDSLKPGPSGEYICVIWGRVQDVQDVPVRVHDQCFTAEVLGSMKCDCREQLDWAMDYIKDDQRNEMGCGMVIYLPQEGRGIGLANKLRAYQMQEFGLDTVDANRVLGLPDDSREYECVPVILNELGIPSIRLITNNPRKLKRMTSLGINISSRIPCLIPSNPHSDTYLTVKRARMGHLHN